MRVLKMQKIFKLGILFRGKHGDPQMSRAIRLESTILSSIYFSVNTIYIIMPKRAMNANSNYFWRVLYSDLTNEETSILTPS